MDDVTVATDICYFDFGYYSIFQLTTTAAADPERICVTGITRR